VREPASFEPLLTVEGLTKRYRRGGVAFAALDAVSLSIARGELLGLVGPSGCGKSTLARVVTRLVEPDAGAIRFRGQDLLALRGAALRRERRRLQLVFQEPLAAFNPRATVGRVVADPLRLHASLGRSGLAAEVVRLLGQVGLDPALASRGVHEISGGQRQRVALARALACGPDLIVLDEALSALDLAVRASILDLLQRLRESTGMAFLLISHDIGLVDAVTDRVAVMEAGRIVETGETRSVLGNPQSAMARALLEATPVLPVFASEEPS
jgi:peptide/nickel transport system ATP-binding protein